MPTTRAVNVHRLIRRIVDDLEELSDLGVGGPPSPGHVDAVELHSGALHETGLFRWSVFLQVDDRLHAELCEIRVIVALGLCAAIVVVVDLSEIIDADASERNARLGSRFDLGIGKRRSYWRGFNL